ncbi:MAG: YbaB/EbfC family nucleoid-associated protein [Rickettsiales bacterium]|nr:YbaB/EbfC family nucleoid-associated protein [Rickettsiales bacterium]
MGQMVKQAQNMQKKMAEAKARLDNTDFEGGSNGVKVVVAGNYKVKNINIDSGLLQDKETLEDLLLVAMNEVNEKIKKEDDKLTGEATGGMKLPF